MLKNEKYEVISAALNMAAKDIDTLLMEEAKLTAPQYAYTPDVLQGRRLQQFHTKLENSFAELHESAFEYDDTFRDVLCQVIKGDHFTVKNDHRYFHAFYADAVTRAKFFHAMDELIAAKDNYSGPEMMHDLKAALKETDRLDRNRIIAVVVAKTGDDRERAHAVSGKLIDMWLVTSGQQMSENDRTKALAAQADATAAKISASNNLTLVAA